MKHVENTEEFVRQGKLRVTTGPQMDRRVLDDAMAALKETLGTDKPSARTAWRRSWTTRYWAAAAVVLLAFTLFMLQRGSREQQPLQATAVKPTESPASMLSMIALNSAYQRGGITAVDQQSRQAFDMLGSQPTTVSLRELLTESNGT